MTREPARGDLFGFLNPSPPEDYMTGFDLAALETSTLSEQGVPMELIHPKTRMRILREDGEPVTITLLGSNSNAFRDAQRIITDRRTKRAARAIQPTQEDFRADELQVVVSCTTNWTFDQLDGKPFPYSQENARKLWSDLRFDWIFRQAVMFIMDEGNFLPPSSGA